MVKILTCLVFHPYSCPVRKACYYAARLMDLHPERQFFKDGTIKKETRRKRRCVNVLAKIKEINLRETQFSIGLNLMEEIQLAALFIARLEKKRTKKNVLDSIHKKQSNEEGYQKLNSEKNNSNNLPIVLNLEEAVQ